MNSASRVLQLFEHIWKVSSRGRRNELRAVAAFEDRSSDVPEWFFSIENASSLQDRAGIDVVIKTDAGKVHVQIKSCQKKADAFKADQASGHYSKDIGVAWIGEDDTPQHVRETILRAAIPEYRKLLAKISSEHGATFISGEMAA